MKDEDFIMNYEILLNRLDIFILHNKKKISSIINLFKKSECTYRNMVFGKNFCLTIKSTTEKQGGCYECVGYPFPVLQKKVNVWGDSLDVKFFIRGPLLRNLQRHYLEKILKKKVKNVSPVYFRKLVIQAFSAKNSFAYIDPLTYLGDSIRGRVFPYSFKCAMHTCLKEYFSVFHKDYIIPTKSDNYSEQALCQSRYPIYLMPDLIESHWGKTCKAIKTLVRHRCVILVPGRNLIIKSDNYGKINVFHLQIDDLYLLKESIDDYFSKCISVFIGKKLSPLPKKELEANKGNPILINPFGSTEEKTIPIDFIIQFLKEDQKSQFIILRDIKNPSKSSLWVKNFVLKAREYKINNFDFVEYRYLSTLEFQILKGGFSMAITADTSLSHLFTSSGLLNITFYNSQRWDPLSYQSLAHDSVLGFCSRDLNQIPFVFDGTISNLRSFKDLCEDIKNGIKPTLLDETVFNAIDNMRHNNVFKSHGTILTFVTSSKNLWCTDTYNPLKVYRCCNIAALIYQLWKIHPRYKLMKRMFQN